LPVFTCFVEEFTLSESRRSVEASEVISLSAEAERSYFVPGEAG
jgi:hypothetical protein